MPPTAVQLIKIHIAQKELEKKLGITDEIYRDILAAQFKVRSSKDLTPVQAGRLLDHFRTLGWRPRRKKKSQSSPRYTDAQMRKVVAIWITMAKAGIVNNGSDQALQGYVKRMTGVDNLLWCNGAQIDRIIESLKQWAKREDLEID